MKEWQRTILLVVLLLAAVAFIVWSRQASDNNLLHGLPH